MSQIDIDFLKTWEGKQATQSDEMPSFPSRALYAALNHEVVPKAGDALPPFWDWMHFLPTPSGKETGKDGHPDKGGFLPPVPLPRRMWAAGSGTLIKPIELGKEAIRTSTIKSVELKEGSTGTLVFVTVTHDIAQEGEICVSQDQNIVYREEPAPNAPMPPPKAPPENPQWSETITPDPVLLFRYSALTYNGHRIHYDRPYTMEQEHYPALVVHGPLLVTLLLDLKMKSLPDADLKKFRFRAIRPTFDTHAFKVEGKVDGNQLSLWSVDHEGALCMQLDAEI